MPQTATHGVSKVTRESTTQTPKLARVGEAAGYLNVSRSHVYGLMDSGQLTYCKIGNCRRIPWEAIERLVRKSTVGETSPD